jgi:formate dehydrogenase subunit gamma
MTTPGLMRARRRRMIWSAVIILIGALVLPLSGYVYIAINDAIAASAAEQQTNPRANYWRAVREGNDGYTAASGPYTTSVLIQNGGQNWRQLRNGPVASVLPWILAVVVLAIGLFALMRGRIRLDHPASGRTVERWSLNERVLHWYTAVLFIILAITGLSLLIGRAMLIPLLGLNGFAAYASFAIALHDYLGPFFVVGVLLEIVAWARHMLPEPSDMAWFKQGGGFFGRGKHPHAGRINAGEKYITFWLGLVVFGVAVCITGLILDFPNFAQSRETMQLANLVHGVTGIIWVALALGHMYLGSVAMEGTLDAMTKGRVSVEWAKQHHDLWYEEVRHQGAVDERPTGRAAPRSASD